MNKKSTRSFEKITEFLMGNSAGSPDGLMDNISEFRKMMRLEFIPDEEDVYTLILMEEVVSQRIVEVWIMKQLADDGVLLEGKMLKVVRVRAFLV